MSYKTFVFAFMGVCFMCCLSDELSKNTECGKLNDKNSIPWTVGIYLEKEKDHLELVCLGTVLKENFVITAAQCVCDSLSSAVRKEHIFVSTQIQKQLKRSLDTIRVKRKDVISRSDYQGFLLNPRADLAILKLADSEKFGYPVCVDWADLNFLLEGTKSGIISLWNSQIKSLNTSFLDHDSCTLSISEEFSSILDHDKNCFEVPASDLVPESIGSGVYFKNPEDDKWYLEGIVSGKEPYKSSVIVAGTSVRHYLPWLSRICFDE